MILDLHNEHLDSAPEPCERGMFKLPREKEIYSLDKILTDQAMMIISKGFSIEPKTIKTNQ